MAIGHHAWSTLVCLAAATSAQEDTAGTDSQSRRDLTRLRGIELRFPRDKHRVVARVDGSEVTLQEVIRHIDENHGRGFLVFMATPAGNLYFDQRHPADWVRHYADLVALRAEARYREIPAAISTEAITTALEDGFAAWLDAYANQRRRDGHPLELTDERRKLLRARYQRDFGLAVERQGWLDALSPDVNQMGLDGAHRFHRDYPRYFGGVVHLAHILIYTRHPVTGQLLADDDAKRGAEIVSEVQARLGPDGSNFEDLARLLSEDRRTADRGGILRNVSRFDSRLPPSVTRAAWDLRDGDWTGPVESAFGVHFVKRLSYTHHSFFLVTEKALPHVRDVARQKLQEDLMLDVRQRHRVTLLY